MKHTAYNTKHISVVVFLLFVSSFAFYISLTLAQFELPGSQIPSLLDIKPALSLSVEPATPMPNFAVSVAANLTGATNQSNANYTWFLNGARQTAASGLNKNVFTFTAGSLGTIYKIDVAAATSNGENLTDAVALTVSDIDLTWSSNNNVPAGYRGKILPTQNSTVTVSALTSVYRPGTKILINSSGLVYNWRLNDKFLPERSGINKSNYAFTADVFSENKKSVRLEIKTTDGSVLLNKSAEISIVSPETLIYLPDPDTDKPYGAALKKLIISQLKSINFAAQNYFFNTPDSNLEWRWLVDDNEVLGTTQTPWLSVFNIPDNIRLPFFTKISVLVKNPANELESSGSNVNLEIR